MKRRGGLVTWVLDQRYVVKRRLFYYAAEKSMGARRCWVVAKETSVPRSVLLLPLVPAPAISITSPNGGANR